MTSVNSRPPPSPGLRPEARSGLVDSFLAAMPLVAPSLVFLERPLERAGAPAVVAHGDAVVERELHPHVLPAAQLERRVRAGADERVADRDDAVEVVAEERRDLEPALELVRPVLGGRADEDD